MAVMESADPRTAIAAALSAYLTAEQTEMLVDEVLSLRKIVPVKLTCTKCGYTSRETIEMPDAKAVVSALTDLITQGYGRPGEAKLDDASITFKRLTKLGDGDDDDS